MRLPVLILLAVALSIVACGDSANSLPTSPSGSATSTAPTTVTERFDAIIELKTSSFYPFSVAASGGTVRINFASLSPLNRAGVLPVAMEIGYGTIVTDDDGNPAGCDLRKTILVAPALTAQLTDTLTVATNYCANIADVGNLREPANFSIRITHP
jgi:hypothetical protein